jgi:hypothetical protein
MSQRTLDDRQREVCAVAGNPINPEGVTRKGVQGRPDVQHAFARLKLFGLPVWLASWVENALGHPVDREHPDALAVQKALQILADHHTYMGVDRVEAVLEARRDGSLLSDEERQTLSPAGQRCRSEMLTETDLKVARENEAGEIASAAFEILLARQWTPSFSDLDAETLRQLHAWHTGRNRPELPDQIEREARKLVTTRMRGERGEIPRTKPVSHTDRRRVRTYYNPSFRQQLGRLYWETDEREVKKLVAELARQTKNRKVLVYSTGPGDALATETPQD